MFADFCGLFAEFCGFVSEFRGILQIVCGILRIVCGILRTNTKGTRAKGHQCEALRQWEGRGGRAPGRPQERVPGSVARGIRF